MDTTPLEAGRPKYPRGISPAAKVIFKKLVRQLETRRTLTEGDQSLLTLAATIWTRWQEAQEHLQAEGLVRTYTRLDSSSVAHQIEKPNLWIKIAENSEKQLVAILDRLGLTPLNGHKVKSTKQIKQDEEPKPGSLAFMIKHGVPQTPTPVAVDLVLDTEDGGHNE